ncbi:MAG: sulfatase [Blastopirellula sp.]|nr:MAG: sulfatase [Blastopirellula sp.]
MKECHQFTPSVTRRQWLETAGCGFGALAFQAFAQQISSAADSLDGLPQTHHAPKAKRVIFLFMHGGVSQVDSFDPKPMLKQYNGKELPFKGLDSLDIELKDKAGNGRVLDTTWKFQQHGESGAWISDLWPHLAKHADDLCFIKSMHTRGTSHGQAVAMIHTGSDNLLRPSVGAWVSYGLGTENQNLPAFVSVTPPAGHGGARNYGSSFLPAHHQATTLGHSGSKTGDVTIQYLQNPSARQDDQQRQLEMLNRINQKHFAKTQDSQVDGVIRSYEMAARMQGIAPEVIDISKESKSIQELYGMNRKETTDFGHRCLLARRFCEAGVRYVQVSTPYVWDQHGGLVKGHTKNALAVDQPISALLTDLKQRGMLDDTLIVWGTEFGRTPVAQGKDGRDHNPAGFTVWLSGAGVKPGYSHGATDDFGYYAQENKVHMHDLHATILHLLGINHKKLTYRYAGRDFRLTDVYGEVVKDILA